MFHRQQRLTRWPVLLFFALSTPGIALAQTQNQEQSALYKSEVDQLLTIRSVSVLPFTDNLQGIYSRPLEAQSIAFFQARHQFDYLPPNTVGPLVSPQDLENDPAKAQKLAESLKADAFIAAQILKGPKGVNIQMGLFLKKDSKILIKEEVAEIQKFDIEDLKKTTDELLQKIINKIPYQGRVMSREGRRVTLNLGSKDGLAKDQTVSVIQITSYSRHPKFNFLVSTEKEILGRIKILKVEETLSFGSIVSEIERNAVQKDAKISGLDFVNYNEPDPLRPATQPGEGAGGPDSDLIYGKNPNAWVPKNPPSFGRVGGQLGLLNFTGSTNVAGKAIEAKNSLAPHILIDGELWLTPEWTVSALIHQGVIAVDNPRANSAPTDLNQSLSRYELLFGYTWRLGSDIWSGNIQAQLGYMTTQLYVDDSEPRAFTRTTFSGLKLGAVGTFPVTPDKLWTAGVKFYFHPNPRLSESPVSSGSNDPSINEFGILGGRKIGETLMLTGHLDYMQFSSGFSGLGSRGEAVTSLSQRYTLLSFGASYFF